MLERQGGAGRAGCKLVGLVNASRGVPGHDDKQWEQIFAAMHRASMLRAREDAERNPVLIVRP